jgi:hypothetical protein
MATDKSEPKVGIIAQVSIVSIVTLVLTHQALVAYFDQASYAEEMRKVGTAPADALASLRTSEKERLGAGRMPIDKAMQQLASKGRMNAGSEITPTASRDMAPLEGWTKLPAVVPNQMVAASQAAAAAASASAAAASAAPSASAAPAASASAAPSASGAPVPPKPAPHHP